MIMDPLRIALAQINSTVGDFQGNALRIRTAITAAREADARVVVFPELALCGYPPEDLLLKPSFITASRRALDEVAEACAGIVAIVGFPERADDLYNSAAVICDGRIVGITRKQYLPNYGVFDEDRYFRPGNETQVFHGPSYVFGVSICEDIWYPVGPPDIQALYGGAELLINISASPYHSGKWKARERMLATRATDNVAAVAFCNLVGGQDELVFDGGSAVFDSRGNLLARARQFEEELLLAEIQLEDVFRQRLLDPRRRKGRRGVELANGNVKSIGIPLVASGNRRPPATPTIAQPLTDVAEIYRALVVGTTDYVRKNGFQKALIGLSGGIDSSLVACVAADALGPDNVVGVSMPSRYSSDHSRSDATQLAQALGVQLMVLPIEGAFQATLDTLADAFIGCEPDVTEENLQSRIRGNLLMALSNKFGWLVLTTGNKSENSTGYATLYGDMAGGFAVIKDVPKMRVYDLARYRNTLSPVIPENVFVKPPSAELRPEQRDSDSLPEYRHLDEILAAYVEQNWSIGEIEGAGLPGCTIRNVVRMVDRAEYKRRQAPPGVKISPRAFGKDRRLPITNRFVEE
jgi:NAD+ synthase (glutamine-hydrolysing)